MAIDIVLFAAEEKRQAALEARRAAEREALAMRERERLQQIAHERLKQVALLREAITWQRATAVTRLRFAAESDAPAGARGATPRAATEAVCGVGWPKSEQGIIGDCLRVRNDRSKHREADRREADRS